MTLSQNKLSSLFKAFLVGSLYWSAPASYANSETLSVQERQETRAERRQRLREERRRRLNLTENRAPEVKRDSATDKPRDIRPGPYVPLGTIAEEAEPQVSDVELETIELLDPIEEQNEAPDYSFSGFDVETDILLSVDPASIGLLDAEGGGYNLNLWQGSELKTVERLIDNLPIGTLSPAQNKMVRKLLLSSARVPDEGNQQGLVQRENATSEEFLFKRLQKVFETGQLDDLRAFFDLLPPDLTNEKIRALKVDAALLDGDALGACAIADEARREDGGSDWVKILTYCQALEGDRNGVSFNLSLLEESNALDDLYAGLIEDILALAEGTLERGMLARQANIGEGDLLSPLMIAMVRTTGQEPSPERLATEAVRTLSALTRREDLSNDFRAEIGKRAALRGALSSQDLARVYERLDYTEGERGSVYLLAETVEGARIDGLLYSLSREEQDMDKKIDFIQTAWTRSVAEGSYPVMAGVLKESVEEIPQSFEYARIAHDAGRVALLSGDVALANSWYEIARAGAAQSNVEATSALVSLWPLMVVRGENDDIPFGNSIINLWLGSLEDMPEQEQHKRASVFFGLIEALGYEVEESFWDNVLEAGPQNVGTMPSLGVWRKLVMAQSNGLMGESVALSLIALGEEGVATADMSLVTSIISGLKKIGLEEDARSLALEVLVAHGF